MKAWPIAAAFAAMVAGASLLGGAASPPARWWAPGDGRVFPAQVDYGNLGHAAHPARRRADGDQGPSVLQAERTHGPRLRHLPPAGRRDEPVGRRRARERWDATGGKDPLFAAYDGSNCPTLAAGRARLAFAAARSRPDPHPAPLAAARPGTASRSRPISRSKWCAIPTAATAARLWPGGGQHLGLSPAAPGREHEVSARGRLRLRSQAGHAAAARSRDRQADVGQSDGRWPRRHAATARCATPRATHLALLKAIDQADMRADRRFREPHLSPRSSATSDGGALDADGAEGGPEQLREIRAGRSSAASASRCGASSPPGKRPPADAQAARPSSAPSAHSVARGARVFREKTFLITDSSGINAPIGFGNPVRN